MKTDAKCLWQAVKNASVYSVAKSFAGGVEVSGEDGTLSFRTCDNYVAITTSVRVYDSESVDLYLSHKAINDLEKALRGLEGEVELFVNEQGVTVVSQGVAIFDFELIPCPNNDYWEMLNEVIGETGKMSWPTNDPFEIGGARLAKLSLLEPKNQYPLSHCAFDVAGTRVVGFKYGPATTVVVMPLDREKLGETYDNLGEVTWAP